MKRAIKKEAQKEGLRACVSIVIAVYTVGLTTYIVRRVMESMGMIVILNPLDIPRLRGRLVIVCNHADLLDCMFEIFLIPSLFFPQMARHPIMFAPWFMPDKHNFMDKWYWAWLRCRAISVERGKANGGVREARKMLKVVADFNGVMIHFPEPGRTVTGEFFYDDSPVRGCKLRRLSNSTAWVALETGAEVFTVWAERGPAKLQRKKPLFSKPNVAGLKEKPILVRLGRAMTFERPAGKITHAHACEVTNTIAQALLELADQVVEPKG